MEFQFVHTPSVPFCLSYFPFSFVPKYCPLSKNKHHHFFIFPNLPFRFQNATPQYNTVCIWFFSRIGSPVNLPLSHYSSNPFLSPSFFFFFFCYCICPFHHFSFSIFLIRSFNHTFFRDESLDYRTTANLCNSTSFLLPDYTE